MAAWETRFSNPHLKATAMSENADKVLLFRKETEGKERFCKVSIFSDDSALVEEEQTMTIIEWSEDAYRDALDLVKERGYTPVQDAGNGVWGQRRG
jgi:hypothetical protein